MEKDREEFIVWIRQALHDRSSGAFQELYQFLVSVYARADHHKCGRVNGDQFDLLIESAVKIPRMHGFAPKTTEMYPTDAARSAGRAKLFKELDINSDKSITLQEWITYAVNHIEEKIKDLPKDVLGGSSAEVSKEEFISFVKKAVDRRTPQYRELYYFLIKTFQKGDKEQCGAVGPKAFDLMIEDAAKAPRRFGLAPSTDSMFDTDKARYAAHKAYFDKMDTDKNGTISLEEWIEYAYEHICQKVALYSSKQK